jgi:transposase
VVLQLICEQQAGIPLIMESLNGNSDDKTHFRETIKTHLEQMKNDCRLEYIVADSALYVAETLKNMSDMLWISRVPETLKLSHHIIDTVTPHLMTDLKESAYFSLETTYGDVKEWP